MISIRCIHLHVGKNEGEISFLVTALVLLQQTRILST